MWKCEKCGNGRIRSTRRFINFLTLTRTKKKRYNKKEYKRFVHFSGVGFWSRTGF